MYTEHYAALANRLAKSLIAQNLPFAIYQVPTVHNSISAKGSTDLTYTKSQFIRSIMEKTKKNVVYIDCDCQIKKFPSLLFEIQNHTDLAIFNWLSEEENNAYTPINPDHEENNIYRNSHSINYTSKSQLICSGAVQLWSNKNSSFKLLELWQDTIEKNPGSADDCCLDYAFNNLNLKLDGNNIIKPYWLPKSYARYAWWIFTEPVIDHPQIPNMSTNWVEVKGANGEKRFYENEISISNKNEINGKYPDLIDRITHNHFSIIQNNILKIEKLSKKIWI
jgi:hypothetical protein